MNAYDTHISVSFCQSQFVGWVHDPCPEIF